MATVGKASRSCRLTFAVVGVVAMLAAACGGDDSAATSEAGSGDPIRLADWSIESLWINNAIAEFIIVHGYDRAVEIVQVSTPVMQQALVQDELDVVVEIYTQNMAEWWDDKRVSGELIDLGEIMETSYRGFYVPRYMIEGDDERGIEASAPDLWHIEDLADYAHLFPDVEQPEKGQIVSCIIGWVCQDAVRAKIASYGLDEQYNYLEPGSSAAMDAAIVSAYDRGEPVVFYYWEPTWLAAELDLIRLEMEPWTPECEEATVAIIEGGAEPSDTARCEFIETPVYKAASPGFVERDPELADFLERMFLGLDKVGELTAWMNTNDAEPEAAALHYLSQNDEWRTWLPDDVAERVAEAVAAS